MLLNDLHFLEQSFESQAVFQVHRDVHEPGLTVSVTVCLHSTGSATGFYLVGRPDVILYENVGDAVMFESRAWHATVPPQDDSSDLTETTKVTLFLGRSEDIPLMQTQ